MAASNPYRNYLTIAAAVARKLGPAEVFLIPLRMALSPLVVPLLARRTFPFRGRQLEQFYHGYNVTWTNERVVEVPIGRTLVTECNGPDVIEVGNVLGHYGPIQHRVVDKFEKAPGVINEDAATWQPGRRYDLVLSISTFEHIGYDDDDHDTTGAKILQAIANCRRWLKPGGRLVLTAAPGYNPTFDALVRDNRMGADRLEFFHRASRLRWKPCDAATALAARYHSPYPFGNAVILAEFGPPA
jgi:SAM-dependent methyltransferase